MRAIVTLNCLMAGEKMALYGERYTGQSVRYHAMQPQHCFHNKGSAGLERNGFGGNGLKFINLDLV